MADSIPVVTPYQISPRLKKWANVILPYAGLLLLLLANYFLRSNLEEAGKHMYYAHFDVTSPGMIEQVAASHPWWYFLLPLKEYTGNWQTTSLIITYFLQKSLSPVTTFYLFNIVLILVAFFSSKVIFHSNIFSLTLAICLGFGTQLLHAYAIPGVMAWYLVFVYYLLILLCMAKIMLEDQQQWIWKLAFWIVLIVLVISYEGWLDFLVFICFAGVYLFALFWKMKRKDLILKYAFIWTSFTIAGIVYVWIKTRLGFGQVSGSESDVVFNYPYPVLMIEDMVSKYIGYLYISLTNFFPPFLLSSNSLFFYGPEKLVELQYGYHSDYSYLIPMQHIFFWRYYAGALLVIFLYALQKSIRKSLETFSSHYIVLSIFLLVIAVAGPTHIIVKARPMTSVPLLGYHVMVSVLGVSLLIAYFMKMAGESIKPTLLAMLLVVSVWGVIFYGALSRPAYLGFFAQQVGIAYGRGYPEPLKVLINRLLGLLAG